MKLALYFLSPFFQSTGGPRSKPHAILKNELGIVINTKPIGSLRENAHLFSAGLAVVFMCALFKTKKTQKKKKKKKDTHTLSHKCKVFRIQRTCGILMYHFMPNKAVNALEKK